MRMMLTATIPHEPFNTLVRENEAGQMIGRPAERVLDVPRKLPVNVRPTPTPRQQ